MINIEKAIYLAVSEIEKSLGYDAKLESGYEFVTVFNDGIMIISENKETLRPEARVFIGKPYMIDHNLCDL